MNAISKSRQRLARRLRSRRGREREGLALVEGPSVILEALTSPVEVRWVLLGDEYAGGEPAQAIVAACRRRGLAASFAPDGDVQDLCSTDAPRAAVACVRPPPLQSRSLERGRYLMVSGVQIPGNLGALIRSAWAFALDGVVVGAGTVDPWNPKAVRASAGGVFHVPLIEEGAGPAVGESSSEGAAPRLNILCADASGEPVERIAEERLRDWVVAVGGEGAGIAPPSGARTVAVPLAAGVDSLNAAVAGSVLMYALTRGSGGGAGA